MAKSVILRTPRRTATEIAESLGVSKTRQNLIASIVRKSRTGQVTSKRSNSAKNITSRGIREHAASAS